MLTFFNSWGFSADPFDTRCLEPNSEGEALLVGRDEELKNLALALNMSAKWICIDGGIGQGKTSLANVAIYKQMKKYLSTGEGRFLIPCTSIIQIDKDRSAEQIAKDTMIKVARSILASKETDILKYCNLPDRSVVDKLFNKPFFTTGKLGAFGVEIEAGTANPNSSGFYDYKLIEVIEEWLEELDAANGAVVCIIDNLELVGLSSAAIAEKIEQLRDVLLTKKGLIWILCGANGSVSGMASTRINAYLKKPALVLTQLRCITDIVKRRIDYFGKVAYFPLSDDDLSILDKLMNHVLRECLGYIGNYCEWVFESGKNPLTEDDKKLCFSEWLDFMSEDTRNSIAAVDGTKSWGVLQKGFEKAKFTSKDYLDFEYSQQTNFATDLGKLDELGLVARGKSLEDGRVIEYSLTPKARLAVYKEISRQRLVPTEIIAE